MEQNMIQITIKLFAIYQEVYGQENIVLSIKKNTEVKDILDYIINQKKPLLNSWRNLTRIAVNYQFVDDDYILQNGDEIAFIPPVSGG